MASFTFDFNYKKKKAKCYKLHTLQMAMIKQELLPL